MPTEPAAPEVLRAALRLDPRLVFLNHGSYGATPAEVLDRAEAFRREMEANPVAFLDPHRGLTARLGVVRERLAGQIGAEARDLALIENATQGVNIVAGSLARTLAPGDEILTTDHEYAACDKVWARIAAETGAVVRAVRLPLPLTDAAGFTAAVQTGLTPRTKVLFLSHVTSSTALHLPIAAIVAEARARGIFTLIDGAHGPGLVDLDLTALGADAYAGNCHKWMMAPKGVGFLHLRAAHHATIRPPVLSHGWVEGGLDGPFGNSRFIDSLEMQGTRDMGAFLALPAAMDWQVLHLWPQVRARAAALAAETARAIAALTGQAALSSPAFAAPQMIACPLPPGTDPVALKAALFHRGIEVPCYLWQGRPILRISVAGYTTPAEIDACLSALRDLI